MRGPRFEKVVRAAEFRRWYNSQKVLLHSHLIKLSVHCFIISKHPIHAGEEGVVQVCVTNKNH